MSRPPAGEEGPDEGADSEDVPDEPRPVVIPERNWDGLSATVQQAMEWGIELAGQLATIHAEEVVVGVISPATIARSRFDQPTLPEPDPHATNAPWEDIAALANAIRDLVPDPSPEFLNALLPPYATAVALGQELQDAQEAMGLPVAPIPFEEAPLAALGGFPLEVPPDPVPDPAPAAPEPASESDRAVIQAQLDRRPNPWVLLAIVVVAAIVAIALGIGWR